MATLRISYFLAVDKDCAGDPIKTEAVTTSTTSAASGTVPDGAMIAKIQGNSNHIVCIGTGTPTALDGGDASFYLDAGEVLWLRTRIGARAALKIAAITV